ncbi:MAG: c-type cytochrome biogenesis protein CcmI [Gammaproteobacteria bacterium]|nr:c-type cytochrome biogenesis protein CcmI [Gammaproteobacteria bacterium]
MTVFWVVAVCLIIAALLFLLPPLLNRNNVQREVVRDTLNVEIAKDKIAELDADLRIGVLSQDQYDRARQELERSLLEDVASPARSVSKVSVNASLIVAAIVTIAIPAITVSLYQHLGGGFAALHPETAQPKVDTEAHQGTIETMVVQLKERLAKNPADAEGWSMLGRSYYFLKRYNEAAQSYGKVVEIIGETEPDVLADYADTVAMASGRSMKGKPYELVKKALTLQPFHEKSLWLAGSAAYEEKDYTNALGYFEKLMQVFPPGSENYEQMKRNIGEIQDLMAQSGMPVPSAAATSTAAPARAATTAGGTAKITGTVKLNPALTAKAAPTDTVFIFARAAQGPRMPLAIVRKQVKDLPITYTLDDSLAMNPAMKLSNFQQVVVGARISKSGNAMPQSGDLQGQSDTVALGGNKPVDVVINAVTP